MLFLPTVRMPQRAYRMQAGPWRRGGDVASEEQGSGPLFAQRVFVLVGIAPGHAQAAGERAAAHHADDAHAVVHVPGRAAARPKLAQGARHSVSVGMKYAVIPGPRSLREIRVIANGVQRGLEHAMLPRFGILRHEHDMAEAVTNLMNELSERSRIG